MPYKNKEEQKQYQRNWINKRRTDWLEEYGPCMLCFTTKDLEIHHVDPDKKEINMNRSWSLTKEKRENELKKCVVLCHDCHCHKIHSAVI